MLQMEENQNSELDFFILFYFFGVGGGHKVHDV